MAGGQINLTWGSRVCKISFRNRDQLNKFEGIMKTPKEMLDLRRVIMKQAQNLPATNAFGKSNDEDIAEMMFYCSDLKAVAEGSEPISDETHNWILGLSSILNDFVE